MTIRYIHWLWKSIYKARKRIIATNHWFTALHINLEKKKIMLHSNANQTNYIQNPVWLRRRICVVILVEISRLCTIRFWNYALFALNNSMFPRQNIISEQDIKSRKVQPSRDIFITISEAFRSNFDTLLLFSIVVKKDNDRISMAEDRMLFISLIMNLKICPNYSNFEILLLSYCCMRLWHHDKKVSIRKYTIFHAKLGKKKLIISLALIG